MHFTVNYYIIIYMKEDEETRNISTEIGFEQPKISDQITGKWFPSTPAKPGTRWFFRILAVIIIGRILNQLIGTIIVIVTGLK